MKNFRHILLIFPNLRTNTYSPPENTSPRTSYSILTSSTHKSPFTDPFNCHYSRQDDSRRCRRRRRLDLLPRQARRPVCQPHSSGCGFARLPLPPHDWRSRVVQHEEQDEVDGEEADHHLVLRSDSTFNPPTTTSVSTQMPLSSRLNSASVLVPISFATASTPLSSRTKPNT
jgi:hypothetical protein